MLTLAEIAARLGGEVCSAPETIITRVGSLENAAKGAISFLNDMRYSAALEKTQASAVILREAHRHLTPLPTIITDNPYAYFARVSSLLNPVLRPEVGIHSSSIIHPSASLASTVAIAAHVTIGANVILGEHVTIHAGCVIEDNVTIGSYSVLEANVTVKHGSRIGSYCHLFSGCVIGNDGFGYAEDDGKWVKIPQVGGVIIEDHVDIGSNTTVDRGAIDDTIIEEGVKIDNLVQIAHNCRIGAHTVIAGCVGVAGSAHIGRHCKIGGAAMILGHLHLADDVTISPGSMIMRSIRKPGVYTALMPFQAHEAWLKTAANIRHLDQMQERIKQLEVALQQLHQTK